MKKRLLFLLVLKVAVLVLVMSCNEDRPTGDHEMSRSEDKPTEPKDEKPPVMLLVEGGTFNPMVRVLVEGRAFNPREDHNATVTSTNFKRRVHPSHGLSISYKPSEDYTVTLSSYYIAKYEVTQTEYQSVMGTNPSNFSGNPNRPVERVSWFDAIEYCNRLSIREGLTPAYSYGTSGTNPDNWPDGWNTNNANQTNISCNWNANGYRLPTYMEWEFAARGGVPAQNADTFNTKYSGSNNIDDVAWHSGNSGNRTHDVGTKAPNELGLFDMTGNVWEWCWDIYGSYPTGSYNDPRGASSGDRRVLRGGSWYRSPHGWRDGIYATYRDPVNGFRVSRTLN